MGIKEQRIKMRKFSASKVEWKYIYQLIGAIENENIRDYVTNQLEWHVIKAECYRLLDNISKFLTIIMPALIVIVQQEIESSNFISQAIILVGATITSAAGVFSKWHDKRILYRKTTELIKEETILYITNAGQYKEKERDEKFVCELHKIIYSVNDSWGKIEERVNSEIEKS